MRIKRDHWWWAIVAWTQLIKKESKWEWKWPYISMAKGTKLFSNACSPYDHVFSLIVVVTTCDVMDNAWCTISKWVESTMTMFVKVWKLFMMIRISTWCRMWQRERWETSLCTCVSFFKAIVAMTSQKVLWAIMCSLLHKHWSKRII